MNSDPTFIEMIFVFSIIFRILSNATVKNIQDTNCKIMVQNSEISSHSVY